MWIDVIRDSSAVSGTLTVSCRGRLWQGRLHEGATPGQSVIDWTQVNKAIVITNSDPNLTWLSLFTAYADVSEFYMQADHENAILAANSSNPDSKHPPFSGYNTVLVSVKYTNSDPAYSGNLLEVRSRMLVSGVEYVAMLSKTGTIQYWEAVLTNRNTSIKLPTMNMETADDWLYPLTNESLPDSWYALTTGVDPKGNGGHVGILTAHNHTSFTWTKYLDENTPTSELWLASFAPDEDMWSPWRRIDAGGAIVSADPPPATLPKGQSYIQLSTLAHENLDTTGGGYWEANEADDVGFLFEEVHPDLRSKGYTILSGLKFIFHDDPLIANDATPLTLRTYTTADGGATFTQTK
jgi:hypothetical protein